MIRTLWIKAGCLIPALCFFISFSHLTYAQQGVLIGINQQTGEGFIVKPASLVAIEYQGYLGQTMQFKGTIESVRDSFLYLSARENLLARKRFLKLNVNDITGLRYFSPGYQIGKSAVELALVAGSVYLYAGVLSTAAITPLLRLGITSATGLFSFGVVRLIFPGKIRMKKENGWQFIAAVEGDGR